MNRVLLVNGGIGKHIQATAVLRALKKQTDGEVIVFCMHPDVFVNNSNADKVFHMKNPLHFYKDYIEKQRTEIMFADPYIHTEYIYDKLHFVKAWCKGLGIEDDGIIADLFLTQTELEEANDLLNSMKIGKEKLVLFQWQGGIIPNHNSQGEQLDAKRAMFRRALPVAVAQEIADKIKDEGFDVLSVQHYNQYQLKNVRITNRGFDKDKRPIMFPLRTTLCLLKLCKTFVAVDSFIQHAAPALDKKGVVAWGATDFRNDGYDSNVNLENNSCSTPHCHRPFNQLFDNSFNCPHGESCVRFDPTTIISEFKKIIGGISC